MGGGSYSWNTGSSASAGNSWGGNSWNTQTAQPKPTQAPTNNNHGLIYSAVTVICSVPTLATISSKQIKATIFTKGDNKIKTPGNMFLVNSKNRHHNCYKHK